MPCGYGLIFTDKYPWFTEAERHRSPSFRTGISKDEERNKRIDGVIVIEKLGEKLRTSQISQSTACLYFHVFFARLSMKEYDHRETAIACLYLACKVEECRRQLTKILEAYSWIGVREPEHVIQRRRDRILLIEKRLCEAIEYNFNVSHPHAYVKTYIGTVFADKDKEWRHNNIRGEGKLDSICTAFLNFSRRTDVCLFLHPKTVAIVSIYYGMRRLNMEEYIVKLRHFKIQLDVLKDHVIYIEKNWGSVLPGDIGGNPFDIYSEPNIPMFEESRTGPPSASSTLMSSTSSSSNRSYSTESAMPPQSSSLPSSYNTHHSNSSSNVGADNNNKNKSTPNHRSSSHGSATQYRNTHTSSSSSVAKVQKPFHSKRKEPPHDLIREDGRPDKRKHNGHSSTEKRKEKTLHGSGREKGHHSSSSMVQSSSYSQSGKGAITSSSAAAGGGGSAGPGPGVASSSSSSGVRKPKKAPQKLPCPRCKTLFTKVEYDEHKVACKEKYQQMWKEQRKKKP